VCAMNVGLICMKDFFGWGARLFAGERYAMHYTTHSHFVRRSKSSVSAQPSHIDGNRIYVQKFTRVSNERQQFGNAAGR